MFPSEYLKAVDLGSHQPIVTIDSFKVETLGQGENQEKKPVISFQGKEKTLVCNKTNWNTLIDLYGSETNDWIGKRIKLLALPVEFKGKMSMAIRISPEKPADGVKSEEDPF